MIYEQIKKDWFPVNLNDNFIYPFNINDEFDLNIIKWLNEHVQPDNFFWQLELDEDDINILSWEERLFKIVTTNCLWFKNQEDQLMFKLRWLYNGNQI